MLYIALMKRTLFAADSAALLHLTGWQHPESPARYTAICKALEKAGIKTPGNTYRPREASEEELRLCHTAEYIRIVKDDINKVTAMGITDGNYHLSTGDTSICPASYDVALMAVGAVLDGVDAILEGKADNVFSLMRPPGHHACRDRGMGFCFFNNIAIAARYAQQKKGIQKVLIVDWDVHHGNGTQDIFDEDPTVFYFSTHQAGLYPGTGKRKDQGVGAAKGTKMNFPILPGGNSRKEVIAAFEGPLVEAMADFKPDFVMISAGFDAHYADPLGHFNLTEEDFATLTQITKRIADTYAHGRIVSALEGGYDLKALANSALAHCKVLVNSGKSE